MTTSYVSPHGIPEPHDAATLSRPQLRFAPPVDVVRLPAGPTWKAGWVVSGLAAALSLAALSVVGAYAFDALVQSGPTPTAVSVTAPQAPAPDPAAAPPAAAPAPTAATPGVSAPRPIVGAPRVVIVTAPAAAPAPAAPVVEAPTDPVVAPPKPVTSPKPPTGIGTCDLVACDGTTPPPPPPGIPTCGDLVACDPLPPAPSIPSCGDLVACTPPPATKPAA